MLYGYSGLVIGWIYPCFYYKTWKLHKCVIISWFDIAVYFIENNECSSIFPVVISVTHAHKHTESYSWVLLGLKSTHEHIIHWRAKPLRHVVSSVPSTMFRLYWEQNIVLTNLLIVKKSSSTGQFCCTWYITRITISVLSQNIRPY